MINYVYSFVASLVTMTIIDATWLGVIAPKFYKKYIGFIMSDSPNWYAATAFYIIFIIGLTTFVVYPGWKNSDSLLHVGLFGALFGLVTYATYDLTNQATLKNWPFTVTVVDMIWGTILSALVSIIAVTVLCAIIK
jgi:uncharacterized membrane protein